MKIRPLGAELFHAVWTDGHDDAISRFRNFVNAPKNVSPGLTFSLNEIHR